MSLRRRLSSRSRWWLVVFAALAMGLAGTYQFLWSTLREPLSLRLGSPEPALGAVFSVYVITQTVSQFPAGWIRDRYGPRLPMLAGAGLLGTGLAGTALLGTLPAVLAAWAVGGVGVGITYTVAVNTPVKWFTDRRGLATGLVTTSFGGTSFLLIPVVRSRIGGAFEATLLALATLVVAGTLVAALVLRDPPTSEDRAGLSSTGRDDRTGAPGGDEDQPDGRGGEADEGRRSVKRGVESSEEPGSPTEGAAEPSQAGVPTPGRWGATWRETVRTWQFWLLYAIFLANNLVGLAIVGKSVTFAAELGLSAGAATLAASLVAMGEAGGVLAGGVASDRLGHRPVVGGGMLAAALSLGGGVLAGEADIGVAFAVLVGAAAFFRTPIFAVFPALVGDFYGPENSSQNYALLYSAKLWGGLGAGVVASALVGVAGWSTLFFVGAVLFAAAGLAMWLVRPVDRSAFGASP